MGREAGLTRSGLHRAVGQLARFVESIELETGATQRLVVPAVSDHHPRRRLMLEELLAFLEPVHRLARFADLGQRPDGAGDREGKLDDDVSRPDYLDPALDQGVRLLPVAHE